MCVQFYFSFSWDHNHWKKYLGGCGCLHADLRKQFLEIVRKNSPETEPRIVYSFMTTAIVRARPFACLHLLILCVIVQDTRAMATTLMVIRTSILHDNLVSARFIEWHLGLSLGTMTLTEILPISRGSSSLSPLAVLLIVSLNNTVLPKNHTLSSNALQQLRGMI